MIKERHVFWKKKEEKREKCQRAQEDLLGLLERKGTYECWLWPPDTPRTRWRHLYSAEDSLRWQSLEEKNVGKKESSGSKGSKENKLRMGKSGREGKISPFISPGIIESKPSDSRLVEINGWGFENRINDWDWRPVQKFESTVMI